MWYLFVIVGVIGYLLGSFSPAYFIGKITKKIDIRNYGSGNLGSTNVLRTLGVREALITFVLDTLKGLLSLLIAVSIFGNTYSAYETVAMLVAGVGAILGHNFPFYLGFKGGKGIATAFGIALFLNPFGAVCLLLIEWVVVLSSGYVSLASVICCVLYPFVVNFLHIEGYTANIYTWILCIFIGALAVIRHIPNIKRLIAGKENKFMLKSTIKEKKPVFKDKQQ